MKKLIILCVLLNFSFGNEFSKTRVYFNSDIKQPNPACVDTFLKLIKQSSFDFRSWDSENKGVEWVKKHISFEFDTWEDDKIIARLFFENTSKDFHKDFQGTGTIAWLEFDRKNQVLQDLLQNKELQFDTILTNTLESCIKYCDFSKTLALQEHYKNEKYYRDVEQYKDKRDSATNKSSSTTHEIIGNGRAYFYSAPNKHCKLHDLFLIPKDRVWILDTTDDFSFVLYKRKNGESIKLWIENKRVQHSQDKL